jgi:hypothetical protein
VPSTSAISFVRVPYSQPDNSVIPTSPRHSSPRSREAASAARWRRDFRRGERARCGSGGRLRFAGAGASAAASSGDASRDRERFVISTTSPTASAARITKKMTM